MKGVRCIVAAFFLVIFILGFSPPTYAEVEVSVATQDCIGCHTTLHPGIVEGWRKSRHSRISPGEALKVKELSRKVSSSSIPSDLKKVAVGCAECHTIRPSKHKDTFEHSGYEVHVVVSPEDCAVCHREEREQFSKNLMSHAWGNLVKNPVYMDLVRTINGKAKLEKKKIHFNEPAQATNEDACLYCHGTKLKVTGTETRNTFFGELKFPVISGWPNQGVGRVNLDGSQGSCSACHTRHVFSMEMARKPYTCKECHVGPDVPVFKVYEASKHGNIYSSLKDKWNFTNVPWTVGEDFTAPTCAACHVSLTVSTDGEVLAERTHRMNDRLDWRIFGLIYSHPHPKDADVTKIRNASGLPLPTDFDGSYADKYLIDGKEQAKRRAVMKGVCMGCHDQSWVNNHFKKFDHVVEETNHSVSVATTIMADIWKQDLARGLAQKGSPFDEYIEKEWSATWLIYANTIRFSAAMAGGGDYSVFANGRYNLSKQLTKLKDWHELHKKINDLK